MVFTGILLLNNRSHMPFTIAQNPAIPRWVCQFRREYRQFRGCSK